jgi:hypothetical protein
MGFPFRAQRRFAGLEFVADDISWSAGAGRRVEGPIGSILLLLTGRTAAVSELSGPGTSVLSTSPP